MLNILAGIPLPQTVRECEEWHDKKKMKERKEREKKEKESQKEKEKELKRFDNLEMNVKDYSTDM